MSSLTFWAAWHPWIWPLVGWTLVGFAAVLLGWTLWGARARRGAAPCCLRCGYDMTGLGLECPECGKVARSERSLRRWRPRRVRRMVAAAALLLLVAVQVFDQYPRNGENWTRFIPTTLLVLVARPDHSIAAPSPPWGSVRPPLAAGAGAASPSWWWACRDEMVTAAYKRPMRSWQRALRDWIGVDLTDDDVQSLFARRSTWVVGDPAAVEMLSPLMFVTPGADRFKSRAHTLGLRVLGQPGEEWTSRTTGEWLDMGQRLKAPLPDRPIGDYVDRVEFTLRNDDGWMIGRWQFDFPVKVVATPDEALPSADSEQIRADIAGRARVLFDVFTNGALYGAFAEGEVPGLGTVPLVAEVLVDSVAIGTIRKGGHITLPGDVGEDRVTLRLRSDRDAAYANPRCLAFWKGSVEIPLTAVQHVDRWRDVDGGFR